MKRVSRYTLIGLLCLIPFGLTLAQDKVTNRLRGALEGVLSGGSETLTIGDLTESQDFSDDHSWDTYSGDNTSADIQNDTLVLLAENNFIGWSLNNQDHEDVIIEVDTFQLSEDIVNDYGVVCRADTSSSGAGYYFMVSGDGYYAIFLGTEESLDPLVEWTESAAINQGQDANTLVAVCVQDYLALYANGELLAEVNDDTYTEGYAGVAAGAFEDGVTEVEFDNVRVWNASLEGGSSGGLGPVSSGKNNLVALTNFGGDSEDTIDELEDLGFISGGSTLIFGEDYAWFSGRGSWFTGLASRKPETNIVMGGELTFRIGDSDELETCTLTSRIEKNNNGDAIRYIDIGLVNDGRVVLIDRFDEDEDSSVTVGTVTVDLDEPHHFVILLIEETANVFVDGELVIQDFPVVERSGSYGIALLGRGTDAKCEGRDIWAYQVEP